MPQQVQQGTVAAAGGAIGWFATVSTTEAAQIFAAVATGIWMITQAAAVVIRSIRKPRDK